MGSRKKKTNTMGYYQTKNTQMFSFKFKTLLLLRSHIMQVSLHLSILLVLKYSGLNRLDFSCHCQLYHCILAIWIELLTLITALVQVCFFPPLLNVLLIVNSITDISHFSPFFPSSQPIPIPQSSLPYWQCSWTRYVSM